jgi:type IV pilus assembly protein PilM
MNLLPKASGTRPRLACEILLQGVVAARSDDAAGPMAAVAKVALAEGALTPGLKPGNVVDRVAVVAAIRRALEQVGERPGGRGAGLKGARGSGLTLVIPDAAVRVLLLDFEALPNRLSEALPLVRFRLKKLLPFDADEAMVTFQVMSSSKSLVRVLAVAIPRDVLSEYETAAREAGYEPGAVLPSTLAALAGLDEETPSLLVNANTAGVTTAIVRNGILLLHRSVDLQGGGGVVIANPVSGAMPVGLPLVSVDETAEEWAAQEAVPEHGRNPYADRAADEQAVQGSGGVTAMPVPQAYVAGELAQSGFAVNDLEPISRAAEIAQAVSVAAAYFEDTLAAVPERVISAGTVGAEALRKILEEQGVVEADGVRVRELVESSALLSDAVSAAVPRSWLSGVMGALKG